MLDRSPRLRLFACEALLAWSALALPGTVRAGGPPGSGLQWTAPAGCPSRADVIARLTRLTGAPDGAGLTARARVSRTDSGFRAELTLAQHTPGARTLEHADCAVLADSVAVVLALSVVPEREPRPARPDGHFTAALLGSGNLGTLPEPSPGIGAELAYETSGALRFELAGAHFFGASTTFEHSAIGATWSLSALSVHACYLWRMASVQLGPCAGAELSRIAASGVGGEAPRDGEALAFGPSVGLFARLFAGRRFALRAAASASMPLARRRFVFTRVGVLHRASALAFALSLGPELRF